MPSPRDYQLAVQNPEVVFADDPILRNGQVRRNALGLPVTASGGFAVTFDISAGSERWAVRCFHKNDKQDRHLAERYRAIEQFIDTHPELDFLVPVQYRDTGITVNGNPFPTVRMRWADGQPLGVWLQRWSAAPDPDQINLVRTGILNAVKALRAAGAAHGDLQHGNILVRPDDHKIWLIDYDGMYLPALDGLGAIEEGHRNYQHPDRGDHYDAALDEFSSFGIRMSLAALGRQPELWDRFGQTGENILFQAADFTEPNTAPIFDDLLRFDELAEYVQRFQNACRTGYSHVTAALSGSATARSKSTRTTAMGLVVRAENTDENTELLRQLEGQTVTVFGTVAGTWLDGARGIALINLGNYKKAEFTIVGFNDVAGGLYDKYGRAEESRKWISLKGKKIAVTGTIWLYKSIYSDKLTPQIELDHTEFLHVLNGDQYNDLLGDAERSRTQASVANVITGEHPAPPTTEPSQQAIAQPGPPTGRSRDQTLLSDDTRDAQRRANLDKLYRPKTAGARQQATAPTPTAPVRQSTPKTTPGPSRTATPTPPQQPTPNRPPPVPSQYQREQLPQPPPSSGGAPPPQWPSPHGLTPSRNAPTPYGFCATPIRIRHTATIRPATDPPAYSPVCATAPRPKKQCRPLVSTAAGRRDDSPGHRALPNTLKSRTAAHPQPHEPH